MDKVKEENGVVGWTCTVLFRECYGKTSRDKKQMGWNGIMA